MARLEAEQTIKQSLLDRLLDHEPKSNVEPLPTRAQSLRALKTALRRDLEWLLNTRRVLPHDSEPPHRAELLGVQLRSAGHHLAGRALHPGPEPALVDDRIDHRRLRAAASGRPGVAGAGRGQVRAFCGFRSRACCGSIRRRSGSPSTRVLELTSGEYQVKGDERVRDELLDYYERELTFLRQMGAEFAEKYPKIASRLQLEPDRCEDPHVERHDRGVRVPGRRAFT